MHPWKQPKPEELRAKRRTPFNDNLKHPRPLLHMPPPETVPSSGPRRPSHYISESGAFEINAMGKQLVINPVPSLPAADAQRKRFMFENMSLFAEAPQDWAACVALVDRADRLLKEWKSKQCKE
jgi:hypothetical protein